MIGIERTARTMLAIAMKRAKDKDVLDDAKRFDDADELLQFVKRALASVPPSPANHEMIAVPLCCPSSPDSDDVAVWMATYLKSMGFEVRLKFVSTSASKQFVHVFAEARRPGESEWKKYDHIETPYEVTGTFVVGKEGE